MRADLQGLRVGDIVLTGVPDPWEGPTVECRYEEVTYLGRYFIKTNHDLYTNSGRCLTRDQPLAYPRRIIRNESKDRTA